jgi:hypothetical protein
MEPPHIPFSFGGAHIPKMTPMIGIQPLFHPRFNPSLNSPGWRGQPGVQASDYVPSFIITPSTPIPMRTFCMMNPPLSSIFPHAGSHFYTLGNPQNGATPTRGNIYNPHHNIPTRMVPNQPLMNMFGGRFYNLGQGYGAYQNLVWPMIPQQQPFLRAWDHMPQA